jgi:hypothetical protein
MSAAANHEAQPRTLGNAAIARLRRDGVELDEKAANNLRAYLDEQEADAAKAIEVASTSAAFQGLHRAASLICEQMSAMDPQRRWHIGPVLKAAKNAQRDPVAQALRESARAASPNGKGG